MQGNEPLNLLESLDYRAFIRAATKARRLSLRRFCERTKLHPAFLSRVLKGQTDLSNDQAFAAAQALDLQGTLLRLFVALVARASAATSAYREHLNAEIESLRRQQLDLSQGITRRDGTDERVHMERYYERPQTALIHVYLTLPRFAADWRVLAKELAIAEGEMIRELETLRGAGVLDFAGDHRVRILKSALHTPAGDPLATRHHLNWRLGTVARMLTGQTVEDDYHLTSLFTVSPTVYRDVTRKLRSLLKELQEMTMSSKGDSEVATLSIDFFRNRPH